MARINWPSNSLVISFSTKQVYINQHWRGSVNQTRCVLGLKLPFTGLEDKTEFVACDWNKVVLTAIALAAFWGWSFQEKCWNVIRMLSKRGYLLFMHLHTHVLRCASLWCAWYVRPGEVGIFFFFLVALLEWINICCRCTS